MMTLMISPEILICSSFLISVCMFIVSKALLISSASTAECCAMHPCCVGVFAVKHGRRLLSSVPATTERRDMGLHICPR